MTVDRRHVSTHWKKVATTAPHNVPKPAGVGSEVRNQAPFRHVSSPRVDTSALCMRLRTDQRRNNWNHAGQAACLYVCIYVYIQSQSTILCLMGATVIYVVNTYIYIHHYSEYCKDTNLLRCASLYLWLTPIKDTGSAPHKRASWLALSTMMCHGNMQKSHLNAILYISSLNTLINYNFILSIMYM